MSDAFAIDALRAQFPALAQTVHGKPLVYLDNAATAHKPQAVIDTVADFYARDNANIHRGVHTLSQRATAAYEGARHILTEFLGAASDDEIIFVRGATEAINLVAHSFLRPRLGPGDEILLTAMEHHANIVPWQLVAQEVGAVIRVIPMDQRGVLILDNIDQLLGPRTKILALVHVSNALGTVNPVAELTAAARAKGIPVLVDGAQAALHRPVDVQRLGCDFYVLSGHKLYGPTGIGVLWGRKAILDKMPPWQGGGDMIREVTFEATTFAAPPARFEAGTPHIAGAIGLAAAVEWLRKLDWAAIRRHEKALLDHATAYVGELPGVRLIGTAPDKEGILSFTLAGIHPHDIGTILDGEGIAVRAGHHCAQPVMDFFDISATARASFALYNTTEEVDRLVAGIRRVQEIFQ